MQNQRNILSDAGCTRQAQCTKIENNCIDDFSSLKSIKCEEQWLEINSQDKILPSDMRNEKTWSEDDNEPHDTVKLEKVEDCSSYSGQMRHWVVCQNGVLQEVKVEQSHCGPETCAGNYCSQNIGPENKVIVAQRLMLVTTAVGMLVLKIKSLWPRDLCW